MLTQHVVGGALGGWWRHERYELRGGSICPARGARLQPYNPWAAYEGARRAQAAPYLSLLTLLGRFTEDSVLDWCAEHGLLGILPHRAQMVILAPAQSVVEMFKPLRRDTVLATQDWYLRAHDGWSRLRWEVPWHSHRQGRLIVVGDNQFLGHRPPRVPGVLLQNIRTLEWTFEESLAGTWGRFFPDVPEKKKENFAYPMPMTPEFWRLYAEPLDAFRDAVEALRDAIVEAGEAHGRRLKLLTALTQPTGLSFVREDGDVRQRWCSSSLLASFALMAAFDRGKGWRFIPCARCGTPIVSGHPRDRFCSPRCRGVVHQREWRERQRRKRKRTKRRRKLAAGHRTTHPVTHPKPSQ